MPTTGDNLGLTISDTAGQNNWDAWMNPNLALLDRIIFLDVVQRDLNTPPGSPTNGQRWHVGSSPTGAWSGQGGKIAVRVNSAWVFIAAKEGWLMTSQADAGKLYKYQGSAFTQVGGSPTENVVLVVAVSDEATAITMGTSKVTFRAPHAFTLTAVRGSLSTASTSGDPQIDVNKGGSSVFSSAQKLQIDANEKTSLTAAASPTINSGLPLAVSDDDEFTVDVDTAGTGAKGLKIVLIGTRP